MNIKRVFLIVLDSLGIGELPDAHLYNDQGSNTLKAISKSSHFDIPNLINMGIGCIDGVNYLNCANFPTASFMRLTELSKGKDTTVGHYEIAGLISHKPFPTYPNGFPKDIVKELERRTGTKMLCNKPYSGTEVIKDYGAEHISTGYPILYTSADSVLQIAAHERYFGLDKLYEICEIAREIMQGEHNVGRIIARPFEGEEGEFYRTTNRCDYSAKPHGKTLLDIMSSKGLDVISIGKIKDIFASRGITEYYKTIDNAEGMAITNEIIKQNFKGLCFINLVDFDMLYGHRNNIDGYAKALSEFDKWLPSFINEMKEDDILILTADHGCDPSTKSTDHSREYVPAIIYGRNIKPLNYGTRRTFADIGKTIADFFDINNNLDGEVII